MPLYREPESDLQQRAYRLGAWRDMKWGMESAETYWHDLAHLDWQVELGADEAISETPVDRYALDPAPPKPEPNPQGAGPKNAAPPPVHVIPEIDCVAVAKAAASAAADIDGLRAALEAFEHCNLKRGARKLVFAKGDPAARVMIVGEAPSRTDDVAGTPFSGVEGDLLDKMLAAIGLGVTVPTPENAVYLAAPLPWRVTGDGVPDTADLEMMAPFLERHIALANPDILILMGNTACQMLLGKGGVTRLRGTWLEVLGRPAMPMAHPANLIKQPLAKRDAWADLLAIQAKLRSL